jgi:hypothetical protein
MDYSQATKQQLLQITLHETCSLNDKYQALRELEIRKRTESHVIELYNQGEKAYDIAYQTAINTSSICGMIGKYEMRRRQGA